VLQQQQQDRVIQDTAHQQQQQQQGGCEPVWVDAELKGSRFDAGVLWWLVYFLGGVWG
jgi:hypothetical protein